MSNNERISMQAGPQKAKRRIRNLLIDSRFQLKWVVRVIFVITVIVAVMGYFLYRTVADATDQLVAQQLGNAALGEQAFQAFMRRAEADKSITIIKLVAWLVALVVVVSGATIVLTHKVAGPVYKMRTIFRAVSGDNLHIGGRLRRGDELREAFDDFDEMLRRLRDQRRGDLETLTKIRDALAKNEDVPKSVSQIEDLIDKYGRSVRTDSTPPNGPSV